MKFKKLLLAVIPLFIATSAPAQQWTSSTFPTGRTPTYPTSGGNYTGILGTGASPHGGEAPGLADEAADIPDSGFTPSQWVKSGGVTRIDDDPAGDNKMRLHCNFSHEKREDPIVFPGQSDIGHEHSFLGNSLAGKDSTYTSLRTTGKSTCSGGPLNRTAYWVPSVKKLLPSGVAATVKMDFAIFYYTTGLSSTAVDLIRFPRNFAYIGGVDPSDYNDAARKAEVPAGFTYNSNGWLGWKCVTTSDSVVQTTTGENHSLRFKNTDGSDPWGGACIAGYKLAADLVAPRCWDGYNLRSPDGRKHLRYPIRHNNSGVNVCPSGWWKLAPFQAIIEYSHNGFSDYGTWYLSSDRMNSPSTPGDPTSLSPCRQTGPYFCGGETMHFDWFGAWSYGTASSPGAMIKWMVNCTGITINDLGPAMPGNPGACNNSTISPTERMLTNGETSPDTNFSNDPVISFTKLSDRPASERYSVIRPGTTGDFTIKHHHGAAIEPPASAPIQNKVAFEGDSISVYWGGNYTGIYQTARPSVTHCALAVGGSGLNGLRDRISGVIDCNAEVVTVLIGANGLANATSVEDWIALLFDYTDTLRAAGYKVGLATILPQYHSDNPTYDTIFNSRRITANQLIRDAVGVHIDAVIDFAADPVMGPDAAAQNTSLYRDGTHPTDGNGQGTGGQNKLAVIYTPVVDALLAQ